MCFRTDKNNDYENKCYEIMTPAQELSSVAFYFLTGAILAGERKSSQHFINYLT